MSSSSIVAGYPSTSSVRRTWEASYLGGREVTAVSEGGSAGASGPGQEPAADRTEAGEHLASGSVRSCGGLFCYFPDHTKQCLLFVAHLENTDRGTSLHKHGFPLSVCSPNPALELYLLHPIKHPKTKAPDFICP